MTATTERTRQRWDPAARPMERLVARLARENRALLAMLRCGWTLAEAERVLRRGRPPLRSP
jgi:hypothetical protein